MGFFIIFIRLKKILTLYLVVVGLGINWKCTTKTIKQTQPQNKGVETDSIFWVEDIQKYAEENNLIFTGVREDKVKMGLDYYTLASWSRYSIAEIFDEPYIAIKEVKGYKVLKLDTSNIGLSSSISVIGLTPLKNKNILELVCTYQTAWSMTCPIGGAYHECYKTFVLLDIEKNKVLFTKVFKRHYEDTHDYDNYNIDSLYQGLYPDDIFEKDTIERVSTFEWFNYHYEVKDNKIEFFMINENPGSSCNFYSPEQEKEITRRYVTGKKPEFYYMYNKKKKTWIKKL